MSIFNQMMIFLTGDDLKWLLSEDLSSHMYDAYALVMEVQTYVVGPIALSLLAIFILLEFQKISLKVEGAGGAPMLGFEMIIKSLIKFVLCYIVILRIQVILDGILAITSNLTARVVELGNNSTLRDVGDRLSAAVDALSWWEQLVVLLIMCVMFLLSLVVRVLIQVMIYIRFMELYVFCAMAPIPMGALPSQEFSSMAKSFFKNFAAIGLQATFIALALIIFPFLFIKVMDEVGNNVFGIILGLAIYMVGLLFAINKTKGWAKALLSA